MNSLTVLIASLVLCTTICANCVSSGLASQMPSTEFTEANGGNPIAVDDGRTPGPPVAGIELGE